MPKGVNYPCLVWDMGTLTCPTLHGRHQGPNGYVDFRNFDAAGYDFDVSINTTIIQDSATSLNFVLSVLEFCEIDYRFYSMFVDFQCHAESNITEVSTIGRNYSEPVQLTPIGKKLFLMTDIVLIVALGNIVF